MSQHCSKCQRVNPDDAEYCFWDGALLQGNSANGGPVNAGALAFPSAFVFPSGLSCQNFDQLAMACQNHWKDAVDLLRQGFLGRFFGGLGRADLAMAAQEALQFPDQDRGLDQLLAKMPSKALEPPKLKVEPSDVNLGTVPMGQDRTFEIHLINQGMRLLFGSIASDSKWLTIGDGPGQNQKIFQFRDEMVIAVQLRGKELRAGPKALEGHLFIDSNGGQQIQVTVRVEVPVKPFPDGVLAGATTPRQIAEKAKLQAKEAATLFENGTVANWFSENGWIYPVQGPSASGLGAVQQFFEALGLAKAPKVSIDKQTITMQGAPNQSLQMVLEIKTDEKRPVYAHASANEAWVDVSQVKLAGRSAAIIVRVPSVPYAPGQTLVAKIRVAANGNQRFEVPLSLAVVGGAMPPPSPAQSWPGVPAQSMRGTPFPTAQPAMVYPDAEPIMAMPAEAVPAMPPGMPPPPTPAYAASTAQPMYAAPPMLAAPPYIAPGTPPVAGYPAPAYQEADPFAAFDASADPGVMAGYPAANAPTIRPRRQESNPFLHLIPLLLLGLALTGTLLKDVLLGARVVPIVETGIPVDKNAQIGVGFDYPFYKNHKGGATLRFGVWKILSPGDKESPIKKLTFDIQGISNSTVVKIDNKEMNYADQTEGRWEKNPNNNQGAHGGSIGTWTTEASKIKITQIVEKIPGDPFIEDGKLKRLVDTCYVKYTIENKDTQPHFVGLRMLWDTCIGDNDGVPFTVANQPQLVDKMGSYLPAERVPDFIQALEKPDLKNPGVVVRLKLRNPGLETPDKVLLTLWPDGEDAKGKRKIYDWNVPLTPFMVGGKGDSCVVMYWDEKPMKPGETRTVGFTYGLIQLVKGSGNIGATINGDFALNKKINVTAYVSQPLEGETLTLKLPDGVKIMDGAPAEQPVPVPPAGAVLATNPNPVNWNITATQTGTFTVTVISNKSRSVDLTFNITAAGIFGGS